MDEPLDINNFEEAMNALRNIMNSNGNTRITSLKPVIEKAINVVEKEYNKVMNDQFQSFNSESENEVLINKIENLNEQLSSKDEEIIRLNEELKCLKAQKYDEIVNSQPRQTTWANVVSQHQPEQNQHPHNLQTKQHVVILEPNNPEEMADSQQTFNCFQAKVGTKALMQNKIQIRSKKFTTNKRVVVQCANKDSCEALCKVIGNDEQFNAFIPKKKNPRVMIQGINKEINKEEIFDYLISQNPQFADCTEQSFNVKFEKIDRTGCKLVIAETSPELFARLKNVRKIFIGFTLCSIREHVSIVQCFKCYGFGHIANNCTREEICGKCSGNHSGRSCQNSEIKCPNCVRYNIQRHRRNQSTLDTNHRASDQECPYYQKVYKNSKMYIQYA